MTDIFLTAVELSISISLLIVGLLLLGPLFNKRYAAKWKYGIWAILALRLILPFHGADVRSLVDSLSLTGSRYTAQSGERDRLPEEAVPQERIVVEIPAGLTAPIGAQPGQKERDITLLDVAASVWMVGGLIFITTHLISYACYKRRVSKKGMAIRENEILSRVFELKHELRIKDTIKVVAYPEADSPMVIGFLDPVLILPEVRYSPEELYFILKHELVHFKRGDLYVKLLLVAANGVHWFNPLVWIMRKEAAVDMELSCDERVIQGADHMARKAYTETLFSTLHGRCARKTALSTQFYGGKHIMKKRFQHILLRTGKKNGVILLLCAVTLTVSLGTLVGCSVAKENAGNAPDQAGVEEDGSVQGTRGENVQTADAAVPDVGNEIPVQPSETLEMMVYIEDFDGEMLTFDRVEWVEVPGERAAELGITEDDAPSGFNVYNEAVEMEEAILASDCVCSVLDWTGNYVRTQVMPEELRDILTERRELYGAMIPYHVTIRDGEVVSILEQYVP